MEFVATNYFLDTEFFDDPAKFGQIDFISIGFVGPKRDFYGVSDTVQDNRYKGLWLENNVICKLPPLEARAPLNVIRHGILDCIEPHVSSERVDFWAHNGAYDHVLLAQLFGGQGAFRDVLRQRFGIEKIDFRDIKELTRRLPESLAYPARPHAEEHIAIHDARHEKRCFEIARGLIKP